MYVVEFTDANEFLAQARAARTPVSVLQTDIVAPVRHGAHVWMRPAVLLKYSFRTRDEEAGVVERVFEETTTNNRLNGTLLERLLAEGVDHRRVARSGSV